MKREGKKRRKRQKELTDLSLNDLACAAKRAINKLATAIAEKTK